MAERFRFSRLDGRAHSIVVAACLALFHCSCAAERPAAPPPPGGVSSLAPGQASGAIVVDGKSIALRHAYAQREKGSDGREILAVLLSAARVPRDFLDGENDLREVLIASGLQGLSFRFVDGRRAEDWKVVHPRLDTGCALCSDWKADLSRSPGGAVAGTAYTEAPTTTQSTLRLEFSRVPLPLSAHPRGPSFVAASTLHRCPNSGAHLSWTKARSTRRWPEPRKGASSLPCWRT